MQHAYTALGKASASLFGLVLVALVFALRSAFSTLEDSRDFHEYSNWVSMAGVATFLYFGFCFLVAFRLLESETSTPELLIMTAVFTVLLAIAHGGEFYTLGNMVRRFPECGKLLWVQVGSVVALLTVTETLMWLAMAGVNDANVDHKVYLASSWILFAAAVRAVALVGSGFWALSVMLSSGRVRPAAQFRVEEGD